MTPMSVRGLDGWPPHLSMGRRTVLRVGVRGPHRIQVHALPPEPRDLDSLATALPKGSFSYPPRLA